jgi:hypothetical protein
MRSGFLLSGEVFVRKLPLVGARCLKGDALAAAARRCFFEAGVGSWREVAARVGGCGWQKTVD